MAKKLKKAEKPTSLDKKNKAKRTGYRFKTEGNPKLEKKDGDLNKKGKSLYFKKPTKVEIEKYKKEDGEYPSETKQVYHERRADRKHSDDSPKKKFKTGGSVKQTKAGVKQDKTTKALHAGKRESADGNTYYENRKNRSDENRTKKLEDGGVATVEMSVEEMKTALGREPKYPYDFIAGKKYVKCFLRPYYKLAE